MPRPAAVKQHTANQNPLAAWLENREQRRREAEEQAAKQITDDMAHNEQKIVEVLEQIDFMHSPIPREVLDTKQNEKQPCGDLEYGARAAVHYVNRYPLMIKADLRPLDIKLLLLAGYFKQSVEYGNQRAAYAAKAALLRGLTEIRACVPQVMDELVPRYIEQNVKYLDEWITLVELAEATDRLKVATDQKKATYDKGKLDYDEHMKVFYEKLDTDPEKNDAAYEIKNSKRKEDSKNWSADVQDMQAELIDQELMVAANNVKYALYDSSRKQYQIWNNRVEILNAKLSGVKTNVDPDALNKYEDADRGMLKELNDNDVELKNTLDKMAELDSQISQLLEGGEGNKRYRKQAAKRLDAALNERQEIENKILNKEADGSGMLHRFGLHNDAEVQKMKQQQQEEEQKQIESIMNEENGPLYN